MVLIVEDDENSADLLRTFVEAQGYGAAVANSLADARQQLVLHHPSVVLLDLHLPDGSGMDLFDDESLRGDCDIVLITGPLTARVKDAVLRVYNEVPDPKVTVAVGVCPISGGIFRDGYAVLAPLSKYLPVDVNVPGCAPRPQAIIEGIAQAIEIWRERL